MWPSQSAMQSAPAPCCLAVCSHLSLRCRRRPHTRKKDAARLPPVCRSGFSRRFSSPFPPAAPLPPPRTDFIITASVDGHLKFWKKKTGEGIEFVKHFRSHLGPSVALAASSRLASLPCRRDAHMLKLRISRFFPRLARHRPNQRPERQRRRHDAGHHCRRQGGEDLRRGQLW